METGNLNSLNPIEDKGFEVIFDFQLIISIVSWFTLLLDFQSAFISVKNQLTKSPDNYRDFFLKVIASCVISL